MPAAHTELSFSSADPLSVSAFTPFCSGKDFPVLAEIFLFFFTRVGREDVFMNLNLILKIRQ